MNALNTNDSGVEDEQRTDHAGRDGEPGDNRAAEPGRPLRDAQQAVRVLQPIRR